METCRLRRDEIDEAAIMEDGYSKHNRYIYPQKVGSTGSSFIVKISDDTFFKRKLQDGNSGSLGRYEELDGTLDDLAEVMCYTLAKNMGEVSVLDGAGGQIQKPLVGCAEYGLAIYTTKNGDEYRGCTSKSILSKGDMMVHGIDILKTIATPECKEPKNTLANYIKALPIYAKTQGISVDSSILVDQIAKMHFCYKTGNSDNHSSNVIYINKLLPDASRQLVSGDLIDNGASWGFSSPCRYAKQVKDENGQPVETVVNYFKEKCENNLSKTDVKEDGSPKVVFQFDPQKHTAFHIGAGNLNGHSKVFKGADYSKKLDEETQSKLTYKYEYDLAAVALSNPEVYNVIYQIESRFNMQKAISEVTRDYYLSWPEGVQDFLIATTEFKSNLLSNVMADYYTYTAYTSCFGQIDQDNPPEMFTKFQEEMQKLPLQQSCEGYQQAFLQVASQNNVQVDAQTLQNLKFTPEFSLEVPQAQAAQASEQ